MNVPPDDDDRDDRSGGADDSTVRHRKRSAFDALLSEVAEAPSPPRAPWEMLEQTRFRVYELLGKGGGGQVYRAFDTQLNRQVALKFLNFDGPERTLALVKEARTQAQVQHPNVCQVYEVIETMGQPFLVLQLVEGPSLTASLATLSDRDKAEIIRQVAEGVAAAHALGIIHRDIKPNNILLQRSKREDEAPPQLRAFITDFGLAREMDKTFTHGVVGTPHFMSPEQARGNATEVGIATDIWALGATLFTLLEGRPPFSGTSMTSILANVVAANPAALAPNVPRDLAAIVLRCLEKDPARRFATASDLAAELARFLRGEPIATKAPGRLRRGLVWAQQNRSAIGSVLVAVLSLGALAGAFRASRHVPTPAWQPELRERQPVFEESAEDVHVSPDGTQLLYASNREGPWRIFLEPIDGGPIRTVVDEGWAPSWAPDGKSIFYTDPRKPDFVIRQLELRDGALPQMLVPGRYAVACGARLFYMQTSSSGCTHCRRIMVRTIGKQDDRELKKHSGGDSGIAGLACDAAGKRIAYQLNSQTDAEHIAWLDVETGAEHRLPALGELQIDPVFHPDGKTILSSVRRSGRETLWEQSLDGSFARELTHGQHDWAPSLSPDGKRLFFNVETPSTMITEHPLDGRPERRLVLDRWRSVQVTRDGRELLATRHSETDPMVFVSTKDGAVRALGAGKSPALGRDDQTVYFVSAGDGRDVMRVPRQGGLPQRVGRAPFEVRDIFAADDGLHLELADGTKQAYFLPYDGDAGHYEADAKTSMVLPGHGGWRLAYSIDQQSRVIPPGPWPAPLPPVAPFHSYELSADGVGAIELDADGVQYHELATGQSRRILPTKADLHDATLATEKGPVYTIEDRTRTRRIELVSYAALPRP